MNHDVQAGVDPDIDPEAAAQAAALGMLEPARPSQTTSLTYNVLDLAMATEDRFIFPKAPDAESRVSKGFDYMMFSAYSAEDFSKFTGKLEDDQKLGIPHFHFGSDAGFLKSANFNKAPLEFERERRMTEEGSANMLNQLAGRYEMQLEMIGNNLFIPGMYVYFDPIAMGIGRPNERDGDLRSISNRMGLGGYHVVVEVSNVIEPGKFNTTIKSLWETSG